MSEPLVEGERQPILKKKPSGKFNLEDFQREDIGRWVEENAWANWSEMGCYKTSTAEWYWEDKLKHIPNPRVLVISTRNGQGPYLESLWEILPEWDIFTINRKRTRLVIGDKIVRFDTKLPHPLHFRPVVVLAHYHCFVNAAVQPQQVKKFNEVTGQDEPVFDPETGKFEMTEPYCQQLMKYHWDMVIVDEAHRIKDPDAQWTRNIKKLKAQYKHIMTGTGFVNKPDDIWSLLHFLFPKVYTSKEKFRQHYCEIETQENGFQKVIGVKPEREQEFRELVRRVGPRHTMLEVFPHIDKPIVTNVEVDLNPTQRKMYDELVLWLSTMDQQGVPLHSPNILSQLNRLRQVCVATPKVLNDYFDPITEKRVIEVQLIEPSSKLDAVMEIIDGLEWDSERKDQVVVFTNFNDPLNMLEGRLKKKKIPYLRLHSKMSDPARYEMWHETWPKKEHQVFLSTLKLGGESINLTSAHRAIFMDQDWSPVPNKQAIGRVYRPGQTEPVQLIYIKARNTVDQYVLDKLNVKHGWFTQIFGERDENGEAEAEVEE